MIFSVICVVAVVTAVLQCHNHVVDAAKMITSLGGGGASSIGGGGVGQHPRRRTLTASSTTLCSNTATNTAAGDKDEDDASCPVMTAAFDEDDGGAVIRSYGVDCSFPIHHSQFQDDGDDDDGTACRQGLDVTHRDKLYNEYISGCYQKYTHQVCNDSEESRISMNIHQPSNVMFNYTKVGYIKLRAPPELITQITKFWKEEQHRYYYSNNNMHNNNNNYNNDDDDDDNYSFITQLRNETYDMNNMENIASYSNHWISPSKILHLSSSPNLRKLIHDKIQPIVESWSNIEVTPSSMVGIRIYASGSVVAPHVNRAPLVLSAVINVAQSHQTSSWPLEVYGHDDDGKAMNITMNVGDMVLYEGHSVIHGRPFPLPSGNNGQQSSYYANVYVHFEPLGYTFLQHELQQRQQQQQQKEDQDERDTNDDSTTSLEYQYQVAWKKLSTNNKCNLNNDDATTNENCRQGQQHRIISVPQYIHPGSIEEQRWVQSHSKSRLIIIPPTTTTTTTANTASTTTSSSSTTDNGIFTTTAHTAASNGDFASLITLAATNPKLIQIHDKNGWTALHEAVRGGHIDIVKYLITVHKLDYNERTNGGLGGSPLYWAKKTWGMDHPVTYYLISLGAVDIPPDGS